MTSRSRWGVLCGTAGPLASAAGCQVPNAIEAEIKINGGDSDGVEVDVATSAGNKTSTGSDEQ